MASTGGAFSARSPRERLPVERIPRSKRTGSRRSGSGPVLLLLVPLLAAFAPFLAGCPYGFSTALPSHIRTLAVPVFGNKTLEFNLEQEVTSKIVDRFVSNNRLKIVPESEADAVLVGEILEYRKVVSGFNNQEQAEEYLVSIAASVALKDRVKNKELWRADPLTGSATYYVTATAGQAVKTETEGRQGAIDEIANQILARTVEGSVTRSGKGSELRYPDLVSEIRRSGPAPVTLLKVARETALLLAEDIGLLAAESFLGPGRRPERIRGGDDGIADRIASLGNLSLFDDRRVVFLSSPEDLPAEAWADLERILLRPMEGLRLLVVSEGTGSPGPRRGRGKAGGAPFEESIRKAGGRIATLWPPFANQLPAWIARRGASIGIEIPIEIAEAILERVGPGLSELANELEKLRLSIGDRRSVGREDLAVVARGLPDEAAFEFLSAIDSRDPGRIAATLEAALTLDREAIALTALVGGHFIRLLALQDARLAGVLAGELASGIGMSPWRLDLLREAEKRFDRGSLIDLIVETASIDAKLKTGSGSPASLLALLASKIGRGSPVPAIGPSEGR